MRSDLQERRSILCEMLLQRISNMMSVIRGTVVNNGSYLAVKVKKC